MSEGARGKLAEVPKGIDDAARGALRKAEAMRRNEQLPWLPEGRCPLPLSLDRLRVSLDLLRLLLLDLLREPLSRLLFLSSFL